MEPPVGHPCIAETNIAARYVFGPLSADESVRFEER
jgi:uncharacterized protein (DUF433 family)